MSIQYGNYEFQQAENEIIRTTAGRMKIIGILLAVFGVLGLLGSLVVMSASTEQGIVSLLSAGENIVVGIFFIGAAGALARVADTQGDDIRHMMEAIQKIGLAMLVMLIAVGIGFVVGLIIGASGGM